MKARTATLTGGGSYYSLKEIQLAEANRQRASIQPNRYDILIIQQGGVFVKRFVGQPKICGTI